MKTLLKLFGIVALMAVIGLSVSACSNGSTEDPHKAFYGTWDNSVTNNRSVTISSNKLIFKDSDNLEWGFVFIVTKWTEISNTESGTQDEFSKGYRLDGHDEGTGDPDDYVYFINKEKNKICNDGATVYNKRK